MAQREAWHIIIRHSNVGTRGVILQNVRDETIGIVEQTYQIVLLLITLGRNLNGGGHQEGKSDGEFHDYFILLYFQIDTANEL